MRSVGEIPVPPVVTTRECPVSAARLICVATSGPSAMITVGEHVSPKCVNAATRISPDDFQNHISNPLKQLKKYNKDKDHLVLLGSIHTLLGEYYNENYFKKAKNIFNKFISNNEYSFTEDVI